MSNFCLPKFAADSFKAKLKSGDINPEKLADMTSDERRTFFSDFLGEGNAKQTNALFESKLLLKNQQQGIINWAKSVAGIKPEVLRDILSKVDRMTEVLQPKELDKFLSDLAEKRLGFGVSVEEAGKIADLAKTVADKKAAMETGGDRLEYGRAKVAFGNFVGDLKNEAKAQTLGERLKKPGSILSDIAGTTKSLKASLDNSAIGRQGLRVLWTNPSIWLKNSAQSFRNIVDSFGGKAVMDELNADILSRPNADLYRQAKLALGTTEEAFPTTIQEKIPGLGKAFKASDTAFTAFQYANRADIFDKYIDIAKRTGVDITDKAQLESIGRLVNSLTGRGNLGGLEPAAKFVNNIFFSPRAVKASIDFLTAHTFDEGVTPFVRKQAGINLLKVISGTAAVLTIANAIKPGSVEKDPRSADFGKIRVGDTRFDVTGGMSSIVTLAARLATHASKSSTTGKINPIDSGKFGAQTSMDVIYNFFDNKLSPVASVLKDLQTGKDFSGNKVTPLGEAKNLLEPLPITTYQELKSNPKSANILAAMIADALGISTNTYSPIKKK